jgi:hypothetical protein
MSRFYDDEDFDEDLDDDFDEGLGGLGEIYHYPSYTPPAAPSGTSPYNTVSDDERGGSQQQQPTKEWSIWDSVAKPKPSPKTRTPTHNTRQHSAKQQRHTLPHRAASSSRSDSDFKLPVVEDVGARGSQVPGSPAPNNHQAESSDYTPLIIAGGVLLLFVVMSKRN